MDISSIISPEMVNGRKNPLEMLQGLGNGNGIPRGKINKALSGISDSETFQEVFKKIDSNKDGKLSQAEIEDGMKTGTDLLNGLFNGASRARAFEHQAAEIIFNQDINNSGTLTRSETKLSNVEFEKIDTNGDKNLDLEELIVSLKNKMNQRRQGMFAPIDHKTNRPPSLASIIGGINK